MNRETGPRVFLVQQPSHFEGGKFVPKHDLSAAKRFGPIVELLPPGNLLETDVGPATRRVFNLLMQNAMDDDDYLLTLGDPVAISLVTAVACGLVDRLNLLKWDKRLNGYMAYSIPLTVPLEPELVDDGGIGFDEPDGTLVPVRYRRVASR